MKPKDKKDLNASSNNLPTKYVQIVKELDDSTDFNYSYAFKDGEERNVWLVNTNNGTYFKGREKPITTERIHA